MLLSTDLTYDFHGFPTCFFELIDSDCLFNKLVIQRANELIALQTLQIFNTDHAISALFFLQNCLQIVAFSSVDLFLLTERLFERKRKILLQLHAFQKIVLQVLFFQFILMHLLLHYLKLRLEIRNLQHCVLKLRLLLLQVAYVFLVSKLHFGISLSGFSYFKRCFNFNHYFREQRKRILGRWPLKFKLRYLVFQSGTKRTW